MTLTYAEIAEIIKLIDASSCEEITLDLGEIRLSMRRSGAGAPAHAAMVPVPPPESVGEGRASSATTEPDSPNTGAQAEEQTERPDTPPVDGALEIRSPMVGTFYRAPSPTSPSFVEVDTVVTENDPLCLIEVMKLYTTISASGPGRVIQICAENGAMVEANEILFRIEPL